MARVVILSSYAPSLVEFRGHLIRRLVGEGHEVVAVAPEMNADVKDSLQSWGADWESVPMDRNGVNPTRDVQTLWHLHRLFDRLEPDVFLGYTIKPVVYGLLAAWIADVPARYALITGLGASFTNVAGARQYLLQMLASLLYGLSLRTSQRVVFQNPDDAYLFCARRLVGGPEDIALVNGSGVDVEEFRPAPLPKKPIFLMISRLLKNKGVAEYIAAAEQVRAYHEEASFRLVGWCDGGPDAPDEGELNSWLDSRAIEYLGRLDDVRPAIAESSVYVLPSYREGTPRTVLEAMAMGRPIITTDVPGCRQTVESGVNGLLVPPRDPSALVDAMSHFVENRGSVEKMGRQSRRIAEERFDVRQVTDSMLAALELGPRKVPPPLPRSARG